MDNPNRAPRRIRFSLINSLLVLTCVALAIGWWSTVELPRSPFSTPDYPNEYAILELPLTCSLNLNVGLGPSWYFSVNSAGQGELTTRYAEDSTQKIQITPAQMKELRELLVREKFFELQDQYGELVPDGGSQITTITVGNWTHSVQIDYLGNWMRSGSTEQMRQPVRALRVWNLIAGWIKTPDAAESSKYNQRVIDAFDQATAGTSAK